MRLGQGPEDYREPFSPGPECIARLLLCGAFSRAASTDAGKIPHWQVQQTLATGAIVKYCLCDFVGGVRIFADEKVLFVCLFFESRIFEALVRSYLKAPGYFYFGPNLDGRSFIDKLMQHTFCFLSLKKPLFCFPGKRALLSNKY